MDSPTCGTPRLLSTLASGRPVRARWMEPWRFSALFFANRSSDVRSSTVSRKKSARVWTMPRSRSWVSTAQPAPSMSMPPRPTKWPYACDSRAGHTGFGQ